MSNNNFDDLLAKLNSAVVNSAPEWALILIECFKGVINVLKEISPTIIIINELKAENAELRQDIKELKIINDDSEQRNRNDCLVIHGIEETLKEDTDKIVVDVICKELGVIITEDDIKRSHRLGPLKNQVSTRDTKGSTRPIIFRLCSFRKRQHIFYSKKKLKGKGIVITESLTKLRYNIYREALTKFGKGNVWTNEGRILTKINNKIHSFTTLQELGEL